MHDDKIVGALSSSVDKGEWHCTHANFVKFWNELKIDISRLVSHLSKMLAAAIDSTTMLSLSPQQLDYLSGTRWLKYKKKFYICTFFVLPAFMIESRGNEKSSCYCYYFYGQLKSCPFWKIFRDFSHDSLYLFPFKILIIFGKWQISWYNFYTYLIVFIYW